MNLEKWAERMLPRTVEQDGECTACIRLLCVNNGAILNTWEGDDLKVTPAQWVEDANTLISELQEDWPPGAVNLMFVAENKQGHQRSQCTKIVHGRNKEALPEMMKGRDTKAITDSMDALSKTTDRVLATANGQLDRMNAALATLTEHHTHTLEYLRVKHENEALEAGQRVQQSNKLLELAEKYGPLIADIIGSKIKGPTGTAIKNGAAAITMAAAPKPPTGDPS